VFRAALTSAILVGLGAACTPAPAAPAATSAPAPTAPPATSPAQAQPTTAQAAPVVAKPAATTTGQLSGTIEFWMWPGGIDGPKSLVDAFTASHPDVKLNFTSSGIPDEEQKLMSALLSGTGAPDIGAAIEADTEQFTQPDYVTDLTDLMKPYADDFVKGSLSDATTADGRILGVPADAVPAGLLYRADLFDKFGLKPEDLKTWDDYLRVGQDATKASNGQVKMLFLNRDDPFVWMQRIMHSELASGFFSLDGGSVIIDDDANVMCLTMTKKLWDADVAWKDVSSDAQAAYIEKDQVMTVPHAVWMQSVIKSGSKNQDGKWRLQKLPAFTPGGNQNSRNSGSTFFIPKQSKNVQAAWEFLKFTQADPVNQLKQFQGFFLFPSNKKTYTLPEFDQPVPFLGGQKANAIWADIYLNAPPYRFTPHYQKAVTAVNDAIAKVLGGQASPAEGLKAAAQDVRQQTGLK
jgi:ABC-type glycerol-3-phosphate transport system substrate-binding protein